MNPNPLRLAPPSPADMPADPWRYLWHVARAQRGRVLLGFAALSVSGTAWILLPWMIARIVDEVIVTGDTAALPSWSLALAVTAIASSWVFVAGYRFLFLAESHARVATVTSLTDHLNATGTGVRGAEYRVATADSWVRRSRASSRGSTGRERAQ